MAAREWCRKNSYIINAQGDLSRLSTSGTNFNIDLFISPLSSADENFWNFSLTENVGTVQNSWQITETFIHFSGGNVREEFNINVQENSASQDKTTLTIAGTIFGHADRNSNFNLKFINASGYWNIIVKPNLFARVDPFKPSGTVVNPIPTLQQVTYDRTGGLVRFNVNFNAVKSSIIDNAIDETINITDTGASDIFAQIQVPGRLRGPVVQNLNTITLPTRSVSINATIDTNSYISGAITTAAALKTAFNQKPDVDDIIDALKPDKGFFYITQDQDTWSPVQGKYARTIAWTIDAKGSGVTGIPSGIRNKEI